jgi:hypothetical protein
MPQYQKKKKKKRGKERLKILKTLEILFAVTCIGLDLLSDNDKCKVLELDQDLSSDNDKCKVLELDQDSSSMGNL